MPPGNGGLATAKAGRRGFFRHREYWNARICCVGVAVVDAASVHRDRRPYHERLRNPVPAPCADTPRITPSLYRRVTNAALAVADHSDRYERVGGLPP